MLGAVPEGGVLWLVEMLDGREVATMLDAERDQRTAAIGIIVGRLDLGADEARIDRREAALHPHLEGIGDGPAESQFSIAQLAAIALVGILRIGRRPIGALGDGKAQIGAAGIRTERRADPVRVLVAIEFQRTVANIAIALVGRLRDIDAVGDILRARHDRPPT